MSTPMHPKAEGKMDGSASAVRDVARVLDYMHMYDNMRHAMDMYSTVRLLTLISHELYCRMTAPIGARQIGHASPRACRLFAHAKQQHV